jgi:hypothetical protein
MLRGALRRRQFMKLETATNGDVEKGPLRRRNLKRVVHRLRHLGIGERAAGLEDNL